MNKDLDYPQLIDNAMRGVVRTVLAQVKKYGMPGDHHFYISFRTRHPGVQISESLRARYPEEMTIVLQHQFWDLEIEDSQFRVMLSFNNVPERLIIPYVAMTAFADPSVKFGLQFQATVHEAPQSVVPESTPENQMDFIKPASASESGDYENNVVTLDAFRKK